MKVMRFFRRNKIKRELPLIKVHTFKDGTNIYTYRVDDFGKISSRYYYAIQEASNYLQTFYLTKVEWESAIKIIKEEIKGALDNPKIRTESLININSIVDSFQFKASNLKGTNETMNELLYCMFYVLEDEKEMGYSEINNKRKIELLKGEPEMMDFFLTPLKEVINSLLPTLKEDTLQLIKKMEQMQGALIYMNMQKSGMN